MTVADRSEPLNVTPDVPVPLTPVVLVPLVTELLMEIPNKAVADSPPGSVAVKTTALFPVADGVPVKAPVPAFTLKPAGTPDAEYVSV